MKLKIDIEQESDGQCLAEVVSLPGILAYGATKTDAIAHLQALALRLLAEHFDRSEALAELLDASFHLRE